MNKEEKRVDVADPVHGIVKEIFIKYLAIYEQVNSYLKKNLAINYQLNQISPTKPVDALGAP